MDIFFKIVLRFNFKFFCLSSSGGIFVLANPLMEINKSLMQGKQFMY
jgi:hypothetical protein